jgi:hypothetical protein
MEDLGTEKVPVDERMGHVDGRLTRSQAPRTVTVGPQAETQPPRDALEIDVDQAAGGGDASGHPHCRFEPLAAYPALQSPLQEQMVGTVFPVGGAGAGVMGMMREVTHLRAVEPVGQLLTATAEQGAAPIGVPRVPLPPARQFLRLHGEGDRQIGILAADDSRLYATVVRWRQLHDGRPPAEGAGQH